jgi:hypothetical protein
MVKPAIKAGESRARIRIVLLHSRTTRNLTLSKINDGGGGEDDPTEKERVDQPVLAVELAAWHMPRIPIAHRGDAADLPQHLRLQLASPSPAPPDGDGWLHEVKHDGHRLVAIVVDGTVRLLSRHARDRTEMFREPFCGLATAGLPALGARRRDRGARCAGRDAYR